MRRETKRREEEAWPASEIKTDCDHDHKKSKASDDARTTKTASSILGLKLDNTPLTLVVVLVWKEAVDVDVVVLPPSLPGS